jgi:predicted amidohydrolase YtcJ
MPGYYADFIMVRDDYFMVPDGDIWKNKVLATYVAGKKVYDSTLD